MTEETETVLDRRRLRRSVMVWRAVGIAALTVAFGALVLPSQTVSSLMQNPQIARIAIEGTITESRDQLRMLEKIANDSKVAALLVFVNSPGGTTTGGEALYEALRKVAAKKPVVAQFGTVAASAGYIVGLGTDHIVSHGNTITGSIGVIAQWPEVSGLMDKLGVKVNEVKSGNLKATPSMYAPLDPAGRDVTQGMINEGFAWFLNLVETRRGIKAADIKGLEQGRIFSGREALSVKLVDEIGGEDEAVRWLKDKRGVGSSLKVVTWTFKSSPWGILGPSGMAGFSDQRLGQDLAAQLIGLVGSATHLDQLTLDGMVSVWHP